MIHFWTKFNDFFIETLNRMGVTNVAIQTYVPGSRLSTPTKRSSKNTNHEKNVNMSSFIDTLLHRQLQSGKEFEGLIPPSKGTQQYFEAENEFSDTYETLEYMALWAYKYAYQIKKVAPLLKGATLSETVENIYKWLYCHFQYKIDGQLQQLYAPSAAWENRVTGFDCKTYSLLASTILQNLSIPHTFRKVKQAGMMPKEWTHVYVIVPTQNNKYLVIDATTHNNKEVSFIEKYDYTMKLKHVGLACPATNEPSFNYDALGCSCDKGFAGDYGFDMNSLYTVQNPQGYVKGLGSGVDDEPQGDTTTDTTINTGSITSEDINWSWIKTFLKTPISCWGGSGFDGQEADDAFTSIVSFFSKLILDINNAVKSNNVTEISRLDNMFYGYAIGGYYAYAAKKFKGYNSCTNANIDKMMAVLNFYIKSVLPAYEVWISRYYSITDVGMKRYESNMYETVGFFYSWVTDPTDWRDIKIRQFNPKPISAPIMAFEFTPYMEQVAAGSTALNAQTFMDSLNTILVGVKTVSSGTSTGSTGGGTYDGSTGGYIDGGAKPKTSNMGMNLLIGSALAYAAYSFYNSQKKSTPTQNEK